MLLNSDVKHIWVHGRNNQASDDDLKKIRDVLNRIGGGWESVTLYPAGCGDLMFYEHIVQ